MIIITIIIIIIIIIKIIIIIIIIIIIQRGNAISFLHTFDNDDETDTIAVI